MDKKGMCSKKLLLFYLSVLAFFQLTQTNSELFFNQYFAN